MELEGMHQEIARLRLLGAAIKGKQDELRARTRQFSQQLERARNVAVRGCALDASLTVMAEIQERLDAVRVTSEHLASIRARAEAELEALALTQRVEQAKQELEYLRARESSDIRLAKTQNEIEDLERFVEEASLQAGDTIRGRSETPAR